MKTDKEFYTLFSAVPEMLFEITGTRIKGNYSMKSITLKEFELRLDGFLEPERAEEPVYFVEFQGYKDETIYHRLIKGMSSYGELNSDRLIKGMILFTKESLDPKTKLWYPLIRSVDQNVQVFYFDEILEKLGEKKPEHPLITTFKPYLIDDKDILKKQSKEWYGKLERENIPESTKNVFCDVFLRWMIERFKDLTFEEVFTMLESLTPIEETKAYKDLAAKVKKNEKIEIARKMLERGDSIQSVIEITELSPEEIEKLKEK